jgi:exodeoxyribonuclease-3
MKIATWNVNGIRARQEQFLEWVAAERPDVVCLQELKASPSQLEERLCDLAGYWCRWHGSGPYSGVSLHVARELATETPDFAHPPFDRENRIVTADVGPVTFASVYVPNGGRDYLGKLEFLRALAAWIGETLSSGRDLVVCGDLNVARTDRDVHPKERKAGAVGQRGEERELFEALLAPGLVDVGRAMAPDDDLLFTWWAPWRNLRQRNIGWRIDYILASAAVARRVTACRVLRELGTSDHGPIVAELV